MTRTDRRFHRQFEVLSRLMPVLRPPLTHLRRDVWRPVRLPLALLLTLGGFFWFLPILGLWMLPAGLLLLAVDLPRLRGPIAVLIIRTRHRFRRWINKWRLARQRGRSKDS